MRLIDPIYFEGPNGKSMARLLIFMAFWPATAVLLWLHTAEALATYLTAFVVTIINNKWAEVKNANTPLDSAKLEVTSVQSERVTTSSNVVASTELENKSRPIGSKKPRAF